MPAAERVASPRGPGLGGWWRTVHCLVVVAGWGLFFWGWYRVLAGAPNFATLRALVLGAAIVVPAVTVSWILHNRGIHRRKGARRHVPVATLDYRVDFHGLEVVADFPALALARRVHIAIDDGRKRYLEETDRAGVRDGGAADRAPAGHSPDTDTATASTTATTHAARRRGLSSAS